MIKGERVIIEDDITLSCDSVTLRGVGLVYNKQGSGVALGDRAGSVLLAANPSGQRVAGILLNDVVNIDETRYHRNFHKDETMVNAPCRLLKKGRLTLDNIIGNPMPGDTAYLDSSGNFTPTPHPTGGLVARPKVGAFASRKDESGFAAIDFNLPA
jgi:hypothetical protein